MALSPPPSHSDNAVALNLTSAESMKNASAFHQDDLWTAGCGSYQAEHGITPTSSNDLNSVVSMCLQQNHQTEAALTSGMHRNASFDSGSTSHDSCTASFSTGSPVTVLPPLPYYSCGDLGFGSKRALESEQENSFAQYYSDGLWIPQDLASDCDQMLVSSGGDGNFSSLLNELPLRSSYPEGVDQVCANYQGLECMVSSLSSQHSYKSSTDNSGSTPESHPTGIEAESSFGQEFLVGPEDASDHSVAVGDSPNRSTSPLTSSVVDSHLSQTARRRLSWSDSHWPSSATQPNQALLHNTVDSGMPKPFVNGFNTRAVTNFQDADYIATCNQYRKGLLTDNAGGARATNTLKRPYSTMQSTCIAPSASAGDSQAFLKFNGVPGKVQSFNNNHQQDAAALSALLYKNNNHGSDLIQQQLEAGSNSSASTAAPRDTMLPPPKLRRRHGTATDPQSIAARLRREKFSDRVKVLQSLVPNGERLDTVSMLGHTLEYVRFLQHQVWQLYNGTDEGLGQPDSETREKWKEFMDSTQHIISS